MAFFGLTALGPQNTFASNEKHYRHLQVFEESDFQRAWERVNGAQAKHCKAAKLGDIMRALFHGPVPDNESPHIEEKFSEQMLFSETPETISFTSYMKTMMQLRDEAEHEEKKLEGNMKPSCEFTSNKELRETMTKHGHMNLTLQQKQMLPLTSTQEVCSLENFLL